MNSRRCRSPSVPSSTNETSRRSSSVKSLVSHCQTVSTPQPRSLRALSFWRSRSRFRSNFGPQKSSLDLGGRPLEHPWACQKQPWTKITFRRPGRTISGLPGRFFRWSRNRYPNRWSIRLTINSGEVCLPLIRDISALRLWGLRLSTIRARPITPVRRGR